MNVKESPANCDRGYLPLSDHGLIGNLHTAALVSLDGSVESYCVPDFDSPSIFARILDKDKGGHFSISPRTSFTSKQNYLPSSNVLQTKFLNEKGVVNVTDYLPRNPPSETNTPFLFWLIRRVEVVRGTFPIRVECAPAFDYARGKHTTTIVDDDSQLGSIGHKKVLFESEKLKLDLRYVAESTMDDVPSPVVDLKELDLTSKGHLGLSAYCDLDLHEGQVVTFVLRTPPVNSAPLKVFPTPERAETLGVSMERLTASASRLRDFDDPILTKELLAKLLKLTNTYWNSWIRRSIYSGTTGSYFNFRYTGSIVLNPCRASWIRDSSFTLYALIRLGYTYEANAYMEFIFERLKDKNPDGSLQIMYTIHGGKDLEEIELTHLDGHKGSRPVRIGNGAADHLQLVGTFTENCEPCQRQKYGKPLSYDTWVAVRELVDYVVKNYKEPDLSIWEVRGKKRHFTYSKVMLWVAMDRARDDIYEEIMHKAWNPELQVFGQSYEETNILDSSVLVMPLVFFMQPSDPRFVSTLKHILRTPDRGGLTSNNLVYRYDVNKSDDGVGGEEGTFCLCTLWCVEALTRAGAYEKPLLQRAVAMFEVHHLATAAILTRSHLIRTSFSTLITWGCVLRRFQKQEKREYILALLRAFISYACAIRLGNAVQGFTHVTLISAAYNLSKTMGQLK
ncbi:hypothetical protein HWV62_14948 [Athelia sp. TMB]|nr:hypothetical protein HWV62_14948 [Athelia sp. TMB]